MARRWSHYTVGVLILASLAVAASPASAHEEGLGHMWAQPIEFRSAGGSVTLELEFRHGPFQAGWIFVLNGIVTAGNGTIQAELLHEQGTAGNWTIGPDGGTPVRTGPMPWDGYYDLRLTNLGPGPANFTFFYDQTCNCLGKSIPPEVPHGLVVFNMPLVSGEHASIAFPNPPVHDVRAWLAVQEGNGTDWPDDFRILKTSVAPEEDGRHHFDFQADEDAIHYIFIQSTHARLDRYDPATAEGSLGTWVQPIITTTPPEEEIDERGSPAPPLGLLILVLALFAAGQLAGHRR